MRNTYRYKNNYDYWNDRWKNLSVDESMTNSNIYPLRQAISLINNDVNGRILEAGCGNGRVLRYFHSKKFKITGIDFIKSSVEKLKEADNSINVLHSSIFETPFEDGRFKYVLAFGLYHNFEKDINKALLETNRIMQKKGLICASFRADNIQNRIIDFLFEKNYKDSKSKKFFHKKNFTKSDIINLFETSNFSIINVETSINVSFLHKLKLFRGSSFDEKIGRKMGYKLSFLGKIFHNLFLLFPNHYCNLYVVYAKKN